MQRISTTFIFFISFLFVCELLQAQQKNANELNFDCEGVCEIVLTNGKRYLGSVHQVTEDIVVIFIEDGLRLEIPKDQIKSINSIPKSRIQGNQYWLPMPVENTYFFGSSARNIEQGDLIYRNSYIFLNGIDYGITDWLSVGIGADILSTFSRDVPPIGYLRAKIGIPLNPKITVGANILHFGAPEVGSATFSTLALTYGISEHHFTLGLGFAIEEGAGGALVTASYLKRVSRRTAFITENYFLSAIDGEGLYSYGFRFFGEKLSVDFGFFNNADIASEIVIGIPYLGFQAKF